MATLYLVVKGEFFHKIEAREKPEEYRLYNEYWRKRIEGKTFDTLVITLGYPSGDDESRIIRRKWEGYIVKTITHPHFGNEPVKVFAISTEGREV